jgi:hypothetical protein
MKKQNLYRYFGRNGILTTPIKLDGINAIPLLGLTASPGHILTNGVICVYSVTVELD